MVDTNLHIRKHSADEEVARFDRMWGSPRVATYMREAEERLRSKATLLESSILAAYLLMVENETMREEVERRIHIDLLCAEWGHWCSRRRWVKWPRARSDFL